ncbi:MAG: class I SAM-dependent methyltransferase [Tetrasphaera sp.]|nr:class I SAM-dependent methyltransferase [Tetrasphaera sp.]
MSDRERSPAEPGSLAEHLEQALRPILRGGFPVRLRLWDGSVAGEAAAPAVTLRSPRALRRLLWHPGELGAAQAYVSGEIEIDGDLGSLLDHVRAVATQRGLTGVRFTPTTIRAALHAVRIADALGPPPAPPATQARLRGRLHSLRRDRRAIAHHYDVTAEFYALLMDATMAYSCAYFESSDPAYGLHDAQRAKLDLVCRKLGLAPGKRLLDVGCGWGSLALHAAREYGVQVTAVTIAAEQRRHVAARIAAEGLADRVTVRLEDYRAVPERDHFDAVASIEMGEHVGETNYPTYAEVLRRSVRPGGRVLLQQMSRRGQGGGRHPGGGPFIEAFIAPDMHMRPVGETIAFLEGVGLEVRDVHCLREHYVRTVAAWQANLETHRERLRQLVGEEMLRVWDLYLTGGAQAFRDGRMGVDQILAVRPGAAHTLEAVRSW